MYRTPFGLNWLDRLTTAMSIGGSCIIILVMAVIIFDVLGRGLLSMPLVGTPEIVAMSIASIVFLQYPSAVRAGQTIRSTLLSDAIERRTGRPSQFLVGLHHLVGAVVFAVILYYLVPVFLKAGSNGIYYGIPGRFTVPKVYLFALLVFSCAVILVQYFIIALFAFAGMAHDQSVVGDHDAQVNQ